MVQGELSLNSNSKGTYGFHLKMASRSAHGLVAALLAIGTSALAPTKVGAQGLSELLEGSKETFVVFPTYAAVNEGGSLTVPMRAWVFEPERDSALRNLFIEALGDIVDLNAPKRRERFDSRIRPFLVDNERGKQLVAHIGGERYVLGESAPHGHLTKTLQVPADTARKAIQCASGERWLAVRVSSEFGTEATLRIPVIAREGISVISDIDDTIKVTQVRDRTATLRRTFTEAFEHVDGMPQLFARLERCYDPVFHYLSASPWQLQAFLEPWMRQAGYPHGPLHLRRLQPSDPASLRDFLRSSRPHKRSTIERLLAHHPERTFVLIGDSGEYDPEIYGRIARRFPNRIERIYIRTVSGAKNGEGRFKKAFDGISNATWRVFSNPDEVLASEG